MTEEPLNSGIRRPNVSLARRIARTAFDRAEYGFSTIFKPAANPLLNLGALGWFLYWIVAVSGVYLFIFFDTGVDDAYASVQRITNEHWMVGSIMRGLHRYASDALVLVAFLHLTREWAHDRMRGPRWFAWVTGVMVIWLMLAAGISGYWVVWDELGQYVALASSEILDALGVFGQPIAHNFVHESTLSGRFFTLMAFIHIAIPLVMLFVMWIHIQRHTQPHVNPPRELALGTLASLIILSLIYPARSHAPAELSQAPTDIALDWFYLGVLPFADRYGGLTFWITAVSLTLLLLAAPWLPALRRQSPAVVNLDECNGCARCAADCPYGAITMRSRTDNAPFAQQAQVDTALCVSCGLCVGSCPTATPFSRRRAMQAGIELPDLSIFELRQKCEDALQDIQGVQRIVVFGCRHGTALSRLSDEDVATIELPCIGMLPPPFLDYLLVRNKVDGILLTGCADGACHERLGIRWTRARIDRERDPKLRSRVSRDALHLMFVGRCATEQLKSSLLEVRLQLAASKNVDTALRKSEELT